MLGKKVTLNNRLREYIISTRKNAMELDPSLTADNVSIKVGRSKSWLSQVENGRLKSVKTDDLVNVFCILKNRKLNSKLDYQRIKSSLDSQIMYIEATEKNGIYDKDGNVVDFSELIVYDRTRGHLRAAGRGIKNLFEKYTNTDINIIEKNIKVEIHNVTDNIVNWINRAFIDASNLFSDEISTRNLFFMLQTSILIYEEHCDYYALNHLSIEYSDIETLRRKLDTDCFVRPKSTIKPLNEYSLEQFDDVVRHFSAEEFMTWKNKPIYIGYEPFPLTINYIHHPADADNFIQYDDINKATGLSEEMYLYIIKQLYRQADFLYEKYQRLFKEYDRLKDESESYLQQLQDHNIDV